LPILNINARNLNNPNELTIENSVLMLVDHQLWIAFGVVFRESVQGQAA
jgi:hypothetical protein